MSKIKFDRRIELLVNSADRLRRLARLQESGKEVWPVMWNEIKLHRRRVLELMLEIWRHYWPIKWALIKSRLNPVDRWWEAWRKRND